MRTASFVLTLVLVFALFALAPPAGTWKWRTHGGVYGTRGISEVAYDRIAGDPGVPQYIKDNLKWDLIRAGSIKPDTWKGEPYFLDSRHYMTYSESQGRDWLDNSYPGVARASYLGEWDNVSYFMGIVSHYWAHVTEYTQHDDARAYYENLIPDPDAAYDAWAALADHLKWQVEYYRPQDPALIGPAEGDEYTTLTAFLDNARVRIYEFRDNTMDPDDWDNENRFLWVWENTRKCENFGVQAGIGQIEQMDNRSIPGTKDCVDMATELIYSGWVYALGIQNDVSTRRISWTQWWSRSHREPGVVFYPYGYEWG